MKTKSVVDQIKIMVRPLIPRWSHARYTDPEKMRVEFEPAPDGCRATMWIYWTWKNKGHRVLISLPDCVP